MASNNFISKKTLLISAGVLGVVLVAALILWLGSGGMSTPDPTMASDEREQFIGTTEPYDPDSTDPGETTPTQPGETTPTQPGETTPTQPGETTPTQPGETTPTQPGETTPTEPGETTPTEPGETTPTQPGETIPPQSGVTNPTEPGGTDPTQPGETNPTEPGETTPTQPGETEPTKPTEPGTTDPPVTRPPHENEEAKLSCDKIASFSGRFVEDGLDKPAENVAALLVTNRSKKYLELATVVYEIDGEKANFVITGLPPGESCWVMEYEKKTVTKDSVVTYLGSNTTFRDDAVSTAEEVTIEVDGNNLTATNNTKETLKNVFVYYKSVHTDGNYFGGITYMVNFGDLKPGQTVQKLGGHYTDDSKIVRIGWQEDAADEAS